MGATTIWERWNSIRPDGSFNPANMNSLNHYAYGSIGNWLYTKLCGLEILEPGYKKFALRPQFIKGITHAELTYESTAKLPLRGGARAARSRWMPRYPPTPPPS